MRFIFHYFTIVFVVFVSCPTVSSQTKSYLIKSNTVLPLDQFTKDSHIDSIEVGIQLGCALPDCRARYRSCTIKNPVIPYQNKSEVNDIEAEQRVIRLIDKLFLTKTAVLYTAEEVNYIDSDSGDCFLSVNIYVDNKVFAKAVSFNDWNSYGKDRFYAYNFSDEFVQLWKLISYDLYDKNIYISY